MNKTVSLVVGLVVVVGVGGLVWYQMQSKDAVMAPQTGTSIQGAQDQSQNGYAPSGTDTGSSSSEKTYTMAEVATHNSGTSCWTAINGGVYDVTEWIGQRPGGPQAILSLCGKDGSAAFNGQHGGQRRPASELASFKIGVLAQ